MTKRIAHQAALVLLLLLILSISGDTRVGVGRFEEAALPYSFSIFLWEAKTLPQKGLEELKVAFRKEASPGPETIEEFFRLSREKEALNRVTSGASGSTEEGQSRLMALDREKDALEDGVEKVISNEIARVLLDEGLGLSLPFPRLSFLFPPVVFEFDNTPHVLVVSPRGRIELLETRLLRTELTAAEIDEIEARVEAMGFSALVEGTGGVATYPSIIPPSLSLRNAISNVAHEWVHQYLFFHPLGFKYWASNEMATINETIASMAGKEVADIILQQYTWAEEPRPQVEPSARSDADFDFNREMRSIRFTVDELLAQGRVLEAETFMEERRKALAERGYQIRKLNQAYFAFHGTYADTPASTSPIGPELAILRERSKSLGDFLRKAARISSHEDLREILAK